MDQGQYIFRAHFIHFQENASQQVEHCSRDHGPRPDQLQVVVFRPNPQDDPYSRYKLPAPNGQKKKKKEKRRRYKNQIPNCQSHVSPPSLSSWVVNTACAKSSRNQLVLKVQEIRDSRSVLQRRRSPRQT